MKQASIALAVAALLAMAANPALACSRTNAKAAGYQTAHLSKAPAAAKVAAKADVSADVASAASLSSATASELTASGGQTPSSL